MRCKEIFVGKPIICCHYFAKKNNAIVKPQTKSCKFHANCLQKTAGCNNNKNMVYSRQRQIPDFLGLYLDYQREAQTRIISLMVSK